MGMSIRFLLFFLSTLLLSLSFRASALAPSNDNSKERLSLTSFFKTLDKDGDGSIGAGEAMRFIEGVGGEELDTAEERSEAYDSMLKNLDSLTDGAPADRRVTEREIREHIVRLSQSSRVVDWVRFGIGLPQYADSFRSNNVVVADFPMLVNDGGALLETEFKVLSALHRQKLIRGMQRQLLALGQLPSAPRQLACFKDVDISGIVLTWMVPEFLGQPLIHRFVIERRRESKTRTVGLGWTHVAEVMDAEHALAFVDDSAGPGTFTYRVAAWSEFGPSPFVVVEGCEATAYCAAPAALQAANALGLPAEKDFRAGAAAAAAAATALLDGGGAGSRARDGGDGARGARSRRTALSTAMQWAVRAAYTFVMVVGSLLMRSTWALGRLQILGRWAMARIRGGGGASVTPPQHRRSLPRDAGPGSGGATLRPASVGTVVPGGTGPGPAPGGPTPHSTASPPVRWSGVELAEPPSFSPLASLPLMSGESWAAEDGAAAVHLAESPRTGRGATDASRCTQEGCGRRLNGFKFGLKRQHFCGMCERWFCQEHTAFCSHGPMTRCELESKCACQGCFPLLPASHPARFKKGKAREIEATPNGKIPGRLRKSASQPLLGPVIDLDPTYARGQLQQQRSREGSGALFPTTSSRPAPLLTATTGRTASPSRLDRILAAPTSQSNALAATRAHSKERAEHNWAKGRLKVLSLVRFQKAGKAYHAAQQEAAARKAGASGGVP